jgi:hypothetical protein
VSATSSSSDLHFFIQTNLAARITSQIALAAGGSRYTEFIGFSSHGVSGKFGFENRYPAGLVL